MPNKHVHLARGHSNYSAGFRQVYDYYVLITCNPINYDFMGWTYQLGDGCY